MKDGEVLQASEEYQIENFEDGTSVLVINNVYPDDTGTISFEAYNPLGVAVTTTELSVEGISFWFGFFLSIYLYFQDTSNKNLFFQLQPVPS